MLIALFGPTSSGKTRLSVELAGRIRRDLGVEPVIISADSRQVYKYMNLGTSKTTPEQMRGIRHEMIDVTEPVRKLELESYAKLAREHIAECHRVGRLPFVVGGTGTHVNALLGGWEVDQIGVARTSLRRHFPRALAADAYQTLRRLDRARRPGCTRTTTKGSSTRSPWRCRGAMHGPPRALDRPTRSCSDSTPASRGSTSGSLEPMTIRCAPACTTRSVRWLTGTAWTRRCAATAGKARTRCSTRTDTGVLRAGRRACKLVADLNASELAAVREQVVQHIRMYARRQRGWFRKLPSVQMIGSAAQGFALLAAGRGVGDG
jgi:tRNA A37 N6-isopentenylltransferase MiaA